MGAPGTKPILRQRIPHINLINFSNDSQLKVGYFTDIKYGDYELAKDLKVPNPEDPSSKVEICGFWEGLSWVNGEPLVEISIILSSANLAKLYAAAFKPETKNNFEFNGRILAPSGDTYKDRFATNDSLVGSISPEHADQIFPDDDEIIDHYGDIPLCRANAYVKIASSDQKFKFAPEADNPELLPCSGEMVSA